MTNSTFQYDSDLTWTEWFCSLHGNEYLVPVNEGFIEDPFNIYGLKEQIPHYEEALEVVLNCDTTEYSRNGIDEATIQQSAEMLYGLIHARYIVTQEGLSKMKKKIQDTTFGVCPRVSCHSQPLLPVGISNLLNKETVKVYCPKCNDIYLPTSPHSSRLDGAFFGKSFPHLFVLQHPTIVFPNPTHISSEDSDSSEESSSDENAYEPRIFGFRIGKSGTNLDISCIPKKTFCIFTKEESSTK
ncbi:Casein kinase II subunit beta [Entamoeba marina]